MNDDVAGDGLDDLDEEFDEQTGILRDIRTDLHDDRSAQKRSTRIAVFAAVAAVVVGVIDTFGLVLIYQSQQLSRSNGRDIKDVLTIIDPNSPRGRAAAAATAKFRIEFLRDQDCRTRRAIAHLPPPARRPDGTDEPCVLP